MNDFIYKERLSNIQKLEKNLNILSNESMVRKPYPTIKTLFYGKKPRNRKNLKKLNLINYNNIISKKKFNKYKVPSIESIINNSKTHEFLSLDNPNDTYIPKILIPINNYSIQNSSYALNQVKNSNNKMNHSINNKLNGKSLNDNLSIISKKNSKMTNGNIDNISVNNNLLKKTNSVPFTPQQPKDLNELYKEFIENVRKYYYIKTNYYKYRIQFKDYY